MTFQRALQIPLNNIHFMQNDLPFIDNMGFYLLLVYVTHYSSHNYGDTSLEKRLYFLYLNVFLSVLVQINNNYYYYFIFALARACPKKSASMSSGGKITRARARAAHHIPQISTRLGQTLLTALNPTSPTSR